ncbi:hypothetical protein MMC19_005857 [Ptychographa xylographoides]|nr:hypothetical protein [Ptychographa xylographoides]
MRVAQEDDTWSLSSVINLINALSAGGLDANTATPPPPLYGYQTPSREQKTEPEYIGDVRLGNFDEIWKFLGQPLDVPPPKVDFITDPAHDCIVNQENNYESSIAKAVHWRDEAQGVGLEDKDQIQGLINKNINGAELTKSQRKKERRRQRKEVEADAGEHANANTSTSDLEPDTALDLELRRSRFRRALIQQMLNGDAKNISNQKDEMKVSNALSPSTSTFCEPATPLKGGKKPRSVDLAAAAARNLSLITKAYHQFVDERPYLRNTSRLFRPTELMAEGGFGIHVFIDISNILIGFHDAIKLSRGLSINSRIPRQALSFPNLALLLERGRPTSKRVLAGSDNLDFSEDAKWCGYEVNILERVHKAKELTPRQKKYTKHSGQSSGSETTATHAPEKWVEQAVDEILHLKILESVVDATEPETMVLATGDAAEAEYSGGFLKMVERALEKGWKVELVSWGHNTSGAYRRREFRAKWGDRFRLIELDGYVEELRGV